LLSWLVYRETSPPFLVQDDPFEARKFRFDIEKIDSKYQEIDMEDEMTNPKLGSVDSDFAIHDLKIEMTHSGFGIIDS